jgi:hypothetical protein
MVQHYTHARVGLHNIPAAAFPCRHACKHVVVLQKPGSEDLYVGRTTNEQWIDCQVTPVIVACG